MVAFLESQCVITRMLLKRNLLLALFQRDAVKRRGAQKKKKKEKVKCSATCATREPHFHVNTGGAKRKNAFLIVSFRIWKHCSTRRMATSPPWLWENEGDLKSMCCCCTSSRGGSRTHPSKKCCIYTLWWQLRVVDSCASVVGPHVDGNWEFSVDLCAVMYT